MVITPSVAAASCGIARPLIPSIKSFWKMEEAEGNDRVDIVNGLHLVETNGTVPRTDGRWGYAASFAGNTKHLVCASPTPMNFTDTDAFTVWAWVYPTDVSGYKLIVAKEGDGNIDFEMWMNGADMNWQVGAHNYGDTVNSVSAGQWNLCICFFNGAVAPKKFGVMIWPGTPNIVNWVGPLASGDKPFKVGYESVYATTMNGAVDSVGFASRVLSADECALVYNVGRGWEL